MKTRVWTIWRVATLFSALALVLPGCGGRRSDQYRQQGDTMVDLGKLDEASALYAQALEANPENADAVVGQGKVLAAQGKHEEAMAKFKAAMAMDTANAGAYEAAVASLVDAGRSDEALAMAEQLEAIDREKAGALIASIRTSEELGTELGPVSETPPTAAPGTPTPPTAVTAPGDTPSWDILWREGALNELLDQRGRWTSETNPQLAQALVVSAVFLNDLALARELAGALPEDSKVRAYLDVLESNDLTGLIEFMKTWEVDPENGFDASLQANAFAFALARGGARARAVQILSQTLERYPDYRTTMANVAWIYRIAGMAEQETRVLQRWVLDAPENMDARTLLFERFRRSGQHDDARQAAEVAYSLFPNKVRANLNLAQAYLDAGQHDVALATLDNALKQNTGDVRLHVARGEVLLHAGEPQQALETLGALDLSQADDEVRYRATLVLAFTHAAAGQWAKAAADYQGLGAIPDRSTLSAQFLGAAALIREGQPQAAAEVLAVRDPSREVANPLTAIVLAGLGQEQQLAVGQELLEALRQTPTLLADFTYALALKAAGLHRDSLAILRLVEGQVPRSTLMVDLIQRALLQGLTIENRLEQGRAVAEKYADMPVAWIGLALLAHALNDEASELTALDKAAEVGVDDAAVWMQRGQYFARKNMIPEAMEAYRQQLRIAPDDPMANNNLAYYLTLTGENMEEALERAQKAKDALGPNPNVLHTLGVAQLRTGKLEESQENLTVALEMRPGEPTLLLDFGQLLIKLGKEDEGKRNIDMAIKYADILGLDFPRRDEAVAIVGTGEPAPTS